MSLRPLQRQQSLTKHLPVLSLHNQTHLLEVADGSADDGSVGLAIRLAVKNTYVIVVGVAHSVAVLSTEVLSQSLNTGGRSHVEMAGDGSYVSRSNNQFRTTTDVVPVLLQREVVAVDVGSHDVVQLGKLDLSRALEELSVSLDQLHGLDVLGGGDVALINSLHLQ